MMQKAWSDHQNLACRLCAAEWSSRQVVDSKVAGLAVDNTACLADDSPVADNDYMGDSKGADHIAEVIAVVEEYLKALYDDQS